MKTSLLFASFGILALMSILPAASALGSFELRQGQYESQTRMTFSGKVVRDETGGFCQAAGAKRVQFDDIVEKLIQGGDCDVTDVESSEGSFSAALLCNIGGATATMTGQINADYTRESFFITVEADVILGDQTLPAYMETIVGHIGDCNPNQ